MRDFELLSPQSWDNLKKKAITQLSSGEVLFCPTDTVFGILSTDPKKICWIKNKPANTPLQILSSPSIVDKIFSEQVLANKIFQILNKAFWPGALSIIAESVNHAMECVRVPAHQFLLDVLTEVPKPVYASSLNLHGNAELFDKNEIKKFAQSLSLNVLIIFEEIMQQKGSTIIELKNVSKQSADIKILRHGPIDQDLIIYALQRTCEVKIDQESRIIHALKLNTLFD